MPLKATQKKLALQKQIAELKKKLALQKRIEDLEIKNQKLEQKLKNISQLPTNTHLGTFDKNSRSIRELFGNTPTDTPKVQRWVDFMRNEIKTGKRSTNWKGMLHKCDILQHHTYRVRCASKEIRNLAAVWNTLPLSGKEEKIMPKQEKNNYKKVAESDKWMNPILTALKELGGSGTTKEVIEKIVKNEKVPDEIRKVTLKNGSSKFENQVYWARLYLVYEGLVDGSKRGVWTLTPSGKKTTLTEEEASKIHSKHDIILKNLK
ncbi:MAG: winged helix-turn-helix domain-containing protein [Bacteroidetes bacterium]|nr:winged helix-turn-helix domain-containing protein [Bacteroidota bacterium]